MNNNKFLEFLTNYFYYKKNYLKKILSAFKLFEKLSKL